MQGREKREEKIREKRKERREKRPCRAGHTFMLPLRAAS